MVLPSLTEVAGDRIRIRPAAGLPMLELEGPASRTTTRVLKRWFDVIGATAILVLASPIFLATALAIKLHDNGPVFYRQIRSGRDGVLFGCYKFRSMVVDAEAKLAQVANQHGGDHVLFKAKNDPGMTGLWQVSGRSDLSWDDTVRLDLFYVDNWSMLRDLAILLRTAQAVVGSRGAY
jgi:lipopolysaccharide/colanic/teichoic acid biosynthesis glycosyltransferase